MNNAKQRAFTLIELLVVVAIISLLISILMPSLRKAKVMAGRAVCMSNLHHIYIGHMYYANDNDDYIMVSDRTNSLLWRTAGYTRASAPQGYVLFNLGHRYLAPYLGNPYDQNDNLPSNGFGAESEVYRCPGSRPSEYVAGNPCWYNGPQVAPWRSLMKLEDYHVTNHACRNYSVKPLCYDYIQGGGNTADVFRVAVWHDNLIVPVLMSDGHVFNWRAPDTVNIPWGYPGDISHGSGVEYSVMGREALISMCQQQ